MNSRARDLTGMKAGMLTARYISGSDNGALWMCDCDCGGKKEVRAGVLSKSIRLGYKNTSCGCTVGNQCEAKKKAKESGEIKFISPNPCPSGHYERYTKSSICVQCSKDKFEENRDERIKLLEAWGLKNKDRLREAQNEWRRKNPESQRATDKKRRESVDGRKKKAIYQRIREAKKRSSGGSFKKEDVDRMIIDQGNKCVYCRKELDEFHIDHMTPVSRGGSSDPDNLQLLCPPCNLSKGNKNHIEYLKVIKK